jgi:DNA-directed RNA polymerase subunit RPC12/RpoP
MELEHIRQILSCLDNLQGDGADCLKQRFDLLQRLEREVHRASFVAGLKLDFAESEQRSSQDDSETEKRQRPLSLSPSWQYFKGLNRFKPAHNGEERENMAYELCFALFEFEKEVKRELEVRGCPYQRPIWTKWLAGLYHRYADMGLQDFFDPANPSRQDFATLPEPQRSEWLKDVDNGRCEYYALVGCTILAKANQNVERLGDQLRRLVPPLTWGETIYHCISYLTDSHERELLAQLNEFYAPERHCLDCGELFTVDKYNRGRFRCPKCNHRRRSQSYRERHQVLGGSKDGTH